MARSTALVASLWTLSASAADLPFEPEDGAVSADHYPARRFSMAMKWPVYPQPHRFDIYGNALSGLFVTVPDPLVVDNGCPKAIEPTYDADGNLAGYAPFVACR